MMRAFLRYLVLPCLMVVLCRGQGAIAAGIGLDISSTQIRLRAGPQTWRFDQEAGQWSLAGIEVRGRTVAQPSSRADSFWVGAGEGLGLEVLTNSPTEKAVRFPLGHGSATYRVCAGDALPVVGLIVLDEELFAGEQPDFESLCGDLAGYVLTGELQVELHGDEPQVLQPGDAFYIRAGRAARGRCARGESVRLVTVQLQEKGAGINRETRHRGNRKARQEPGVTAPESLGAAKHRGRPVMRKREL